MRFHKDWIIHLWDSADKVQTQGKEDETVQRHEVPSPRLGGLRKAHKYHPKKENASKH